MRVGIVTTTIGPNDGQGRVNREIAAECLRQGHDVVLFAERVDDGMAPEAGVTPVLAAPPGWLPTRMLRDQVFAWRSRRGIADARNRCDVLLANGFVTWGPSDVNAVHFVHDSWARSSWHPWRQRRDARSLYASAYSRLNSLLERHAFRQARHVVAVSDSVRQELLRLGVPAASITVITNGVDTDEFCPGPSERDRFGLPGSVRIALFAGDMKTPRKNLDTVLRAQAAVPELHVAVAGRAEDTPYPALARQLGIADRVHFLGFQRDMPTLMRSVDLLLFPSRYEACSLVLLEALASGLPVVTARSAGGSELLTPEVGVVLQDSDDHAMLAQVVTGLLGNDAERRAMSVRARELARAHSWEGMARRYVDLLQTAARERRPAHA